MNYLVYKHITPNGKVYIGITSRTLQQRKSSGYNNNPHFTRAIKKYSWENIQTEILFENLTATEAKEKEITLIKFYKSTNPEFGYNQSRGGESHSGCSFNHSEESKEKIRKNNAHYWKGKKRKPLSEEHKQKLLVSQSIPVQCIETGEIFISMNEARRCTGITHIYDCCNGKLKTSGGYHWKYIKEGD